MSSQIRSYAYTYKYNANKCQSDVSKKDYEPVLNLLNKTGVVIENIYETDKSGRLHIHGIWQNTGRTPLFCRMCPKGYHSHFEEIYDEEGWQKYLFKDYFKNNVA